MRTPLGIVAILVVTLLLVSTPAVAQIGGPGWSAGMAVNTNVIGDVEQLATVDVNGTVQLVEERKNAVRPVLEGHVAFPIAPWVAVGPFLAAAAGEDIIDEIGFGGLATLTRGEQSFRLGVGAWLNPNTRSCGTTSCWVSRRRLA